MEGYSLLWIWYIISTLFSIAILIKIKVKFKVFCVLFPAVVFLAWLIIPIFLLHFIFKTLEVRKLDQIESAINQPGMDSEEQGKSME